MWVSFFQLLHNVLVPFVTVATVATHNNAVVWVDVLTCVVPYAYIGLHKVLLYFLVDDVCFAIALLHTDPRPFVPVHEPTAANPVQQHCISVVRRLTTVFLQNEKLEALLEVICVHDRRQARGWR